MAVYVPSKDQLDKAKAKNCFILVVNGVYNNKVYEAWEAYMYRKGIQTSNIAGYLQDPKKDSFKAITYWVKYKAPNIDLILAYAKTHPEAGMHIFI